MHQFWCLHALVNNFPVMVGYPTVALLVIVLCQQTEWWFLNYSEENGHLFSIVTISKKGDRLIFSNHDSKTRSFYIMTKTLKNNFSIKCEVPF